MFNGTKKVVVFLASQGSDDHKQGIFPESRVRYFRRPSHIRGVIYSKYVWDRKDLKGLIQLTTVDFAFFCRSIPITLWVGSLLAVARGGILCQLGND